MIMFKKLLVPIVTSSVVFSTFSYAEPNTPTDKQLLKQEEKLAKKNDKQREYKVVENRFIVTFHDDVKNHSKVAKDMAGKKKFKIKKNYKSAIKGFSAEMTPEQAMELAENPNVAHVEPDVYIYSNATTETEPVSVPLGVERIGTRYNGIAQIDGVDERVDIDVAVIDSGIDLDHPDLNVYHGETFLSNTLACLVYTTPENAGNDNFGHGTHVAGTIGALDDGQGVVGVAPGVRLWAMKVLCPDGTTEIRGFKSDLVEALDYIHGVDEDNDGRSDIEVVNMSLGWVGYSTSVRNAIRALVEDGVVVVAAAGNESRDVYGSDGKLIPVVSGWCYYFGINCKSHEWAKVPAAYPEVLAVSALTDTDGNSGGLGPNFYISSNDKFYYDDTLAWFSNYSGALDINEDDLVGWSVLSPGSAIDLAAPGVDIYSTYLDGSYAHMSGTSMASPHVAGAVALWIAEHGRPTDAEGVYQLRQALIDHAISKGDYVLDELYDAYREPVLNANFSN